MPHSSRSTFEISPIVTRARSASRIGGSRFSSVAATRAHLGEGALRLVRVPLGTNACGPLELAPLDRRVEAVQLDVLLFVLREAVDADDHALARLDLLVPAEGGLLDLRWTKPCSTAATAPPSSSIRSISSSARCSSSSVSASMK